MPRRSPPRPALSAGRATALALALALVTSCTAPEGGPPPAARRAVTGSQLAQVQGDAAEQKLLFDAEERMIATCMRERGRPYRPLAWHSRSPLPEEDPRNGDDVALRRRAGYGAAAAAAPPPPADPNGDHMRSLPREQRARYGQALLGTAAHRIDVELPDGVAFLNADGCIARAERRLYGDLATWLKAQMVVVNLEGEVSRRIFADKRVGRTVGPWRACMKAAGHAYSDPEAARAEFVEAYRASAERGAGRDGTAQLRRREVRVAVADALCDRRVGRSRVIRLLDRKHRGELARERGQDIGTYRVLRERALARVE
ncbi:hypothetical protein [Streptomyces sp. enrichment culture]|uniref:hypothetical protein n=1 Tax=Streptomyces sp. enrichment culture TaxID=1795815 RepID=UPI003F54EA52